MCAGLGRRPEHLLPPSGRRFQSILEQWRSILHLELHHHADSKENSLVVINSMAEAMLKAMKVLDAFIERLVSSSGSALEHT